MIFKKKSDLLKGENQGWKCCIANKERRLSAAVFLSLSQHQSLFVFLLTLRQRCRRGPGEQPGPWSILWTVCGASEPAETDSRLRSPRRRSPAPGTARRGC